MIQGRHRLRCALLALLALALLSGGSLAAGDLFDDDYADCPHKTRLREGQIADLTVARDAEEEDEVNVAWAATDPATWGLGANAYSASLVVLLADGVNPLQAKTVSLGTRKQTFSGVATGAKVTVQMAIVVDTAEGDYLISDILEATVNQSLTAPSFSTGWIIKGAHDGFGDSLTNQGFVDIPLPELGRMYYLGYNANFGNYRAGEGLTFTTEPATPRLRIGLAHGGENDEAREDVKFDAYVLRLLDEDGDIVPDGDDVRTMVSDYGQSFATSISDTFTDGYYDNHLVLQLEYGTAHGFVNFPTAAGVTARAALLASKPIVNVRINDSGAITQPMYQKASLTWEAPGDGGPSPANKIVGISVIVPNGGAVYALPPDAHRDFPIDVLASDRTYTIEAWAVNEDGEVISPKTTLKVHPREQAPTTLGSGTASFRDYLSSSPVTSGTLLTTEFTVLK